MVALLGNVNSWALNRSAASLALVQVPYCTSKSINQSIICIFDISLLFSIIKLLDMRNRSRNRNIRARKEWLSTWRRSQQSTDKPAMPGRKNMPNLINLSSQSLLVFILLVLLLTVVGAVGTLVGVKYGTLGVFGGKGCSVPGV